MPNDYFSFKQFTIRQERCSFKVGTDGVILGAYSDVAGITRVLDIGSGTGLIALMLAQRCNAEITALEPDTDSYDQMCENFRNSAWGSRLIAVNSTLQEFRSTGKFELIVSNPPYFINSIRNPDNRKSASRHNDTLCHDDLLSGVARLLDDKGRFQVIMPYAEGNILIAMASGYGLYCSNILKIKSLPTSEIRRLVLSFSRVKTVPRERFLTIEHGPRHEFTAEYKALTRDFYLKF